MFSHERKVDAPPLAKQPSLFARRFKSATIQPRACTVQSQSSMNRSTSTTANFAKSEISEIHQQRARASVYYVGVLNTLGNTTRRDAATPYYRSYFPPKRNVVQPAYFTYVKRTRKPPLAEALCSTRGTCPRRRPSICSRRSANLYTLRGDGSSDRYREFSCMRECESADPRERHLIRNGSTNFA